MACIRSFRFQQAKSHRTVFFFALGKASEAKVDHRCCVTLLQNKSLADLMFGSLYDDKTRCGKQAAFVSIPFQALSYLHAEQLVLDLTPNPNLGGAEWVHRHTTDPASVPGSCLTLGSTFAKNEAPTLPLPKPEQEANSVSHGIKSCATGR